MTSNKPFGLEAVTFDEIQREEKSRRDRERIAQRLAAPLKGGLGELNQYRLDLGGLEGADLFNPVLSANPH